jgi:hypothetical protein
VYRVVLVLILGCCGTEPKGEPAWFPATYRTTYQEVRDCRRSLEHSATIRILVSADAVDAFARTAPFPTGSIVLKEEYGLPDVTCAEPIERYTVMRKLEVGSAPDTLDWEWQEVGDDLHEIERGTDIPHCVNCHRVCGKAPMGYDGTCAELP